MKKFLAKKPVMIAFVAAAVVFLVTYIGLLVRPVAIGFNYSQTEDGVTISYNFGFKKVEATMTDGKNEESMEAYYYCQDNIVILDYANAVKNDKDYKEWKKDIQENWNTYKNMGFEVNAFEFNEDYTCVESIVFAVIGGIITVALLTFGTLSVLYFVKGKKKA